jgi:hypothetical protein
VTLTLPDNVAQRLAEVAETSGMTVEALAAEYVAREATTEHALAGRNCYERRRHGASWGEIAEVCGYPRPSFGCQMARVYALAHRLPWPVGVDHRRVE